MFRCLRRHDRRRRKLMIECFIGDGLWRWLLMFECWRWAFGRCINAKAKRPGVWLLFFDYCMLALGVRRLGLASGFGTLAVVCVGVWLVCFQMFEFVACALQIFARIVQLRFILYVLANTCFPYAESHKSKRHKPNIKRGHPTSKQQQPKTNNTNRQTHTRNQQQAAKHQQPTCISQNIKRQHPTTNIQQPYTNNQTPNARARSQKPTTKRQTPNANNQTHTKNNPNAKPYTKSQTFSNNCKHNCKHNVEISRNQTTNVV